MGGSFTSSKIIFIAESLLDGSLIYDEESNPE